MTSRTRGGHLREEIFMITDQERTEGDALCGSINDKLDL
jgi:hypothetical protein